MRKALLLGPLLTVLAVFAAVLVACGGDDDDGDGGAANAQPDVAPTAAVQQFALKGSESGETYSFDNKELRARVGSMKLTLTNAGPERPHGIQVKSKDGSSNLASLDRVEVGQTGTLDLTIMEPGTYQFICPIRGHVDRGMTGTLTVTAN